MKKRILIILLLLVALFFYSKLKMNSKNPAILYVLLSQIENNIQFRDRMNEDVSKVDVAWQLDHALKTVNRITKDLEVSRPEDYKSSISLSRSLSLTMGYIPRGRAQSPDVVRPPEIILTKELYDQLEKAKLNVKKLMSLNENTHFNHPVFGVLNKAQTIRFLEVHTKHHLKIIDDILK